MHFGILLKDFGTDGNLRGITVAKRTLYSAESTGLTLYIDSGARFLIFPETHSKLFRKIANYAVYFLKN